MKKILKFKKNIFKKEIIKPYTPGCEITNNLSSLKNLKRDLINIKDKFGNYLSREIWLIHKNNLPPKTKRCTSSILSLHETNSLTTHFFDNFEDLENIKLITVINFNYKDLDEQILKINKIIEFLERIRSNSMSLEVLLKKIEEYPTWIVYHMESIGIKKTWLTSFLNDIQLYFKELKIPKNEISLEGELIINFSSQITKSEFISKNQIETHYRDSAYNPHTILVNSNFVNDFTNIKSVHKNVTIPSLSHQEIQYAGELYSNFDDLKEDAPTIGILDSKIPTTSIFYKYIKVTSLLESENQVDHGEAVASIAMFGDRLNNFDDGCGVFNIELFEVFEPDISISQLLERIRIAIKSRYKDIKVWNLSINAVFEDALENGEPTWLASELDDIQNQYGVIIVQSAGNQTSNASLKIKSPSDSINSLVVSSTKSINSHIPSSFSLDGYGDFATRKPDVSFFGGDSNNEVMALKNGRISKFNGGTSFSAPFVARKLAYLFYIENFSLLEAKALIIHSSFKNYDNNDINNKIGWGVVPNDIKDIINTSPDEIRFIFNENINSTKRFFYDLRIPEDNEQEYSTYLTYISSGNLNKKYGCEYIRNSINISYGPLHNNKIVSSRKIKPHSISNEDNEVIANEKKLIKIYGKWKNTFCGKDIVKRYRGTYQEGYGIKAKWDKRMSVGNNFSSQNVICIATIKHNKGIDRYNEFVQMNELNLDIENRIILEGDIVLSN